jgi:hypothetical protein
VEPSRDKILFNVQDHFPSRLATFKQCSSAKLYDHNKLQKVLGKTYKSTCFKSLRLYEGSIKNSEAVPWLRWLVSDLSPRRPGFALGSVYVVFVVDKVAQRQAFLRVLRFSPVTIIPPWPSILMYHLGDEQ